MLPFPAFQVGSLHSPSLFKTKPQKTTKEPTPHHWIPVLCWQVEHGFECAFFGDIQTAVLSSSPQSRLALAASVPKGIPWTFLQMWKCPS